MSKKISLIIAIVIALLGVIFVSIFGKLPEHLIPKIYMEKLYFQDERIELSKSGNKILYFDISIDNLYINLDDMVKYEPNDTTNIAVIYSLDDNTIASITTTGLLIFEESAISTFGKFLAFILITAKSAEIWYPTTVAE